MVRSSNQLLRENNQVLLLEIHKKNQELDDQKKIWEMELVDVKNTINNIKVKKTVRY